jgi:hypothetical protein
VKKYAYEAEGFRKLDETAEWMNEMGERGYRVHTFHVMDELLEGSSTEEVWIAVLMERTIDADGV